MNVAPVPKAKAPRYPDAEAARLDPRLLERLPERWKADARAVALVATLAASACGTGPERRDGPGARAIVAPLVVHGDGTLFYGGMGGGKVPISEDEARAIIEAEFAKTGISIERERVTVDGVMLPVTYVYDSFDKYHPDAVEKVRSKPGSLVLDGSSTGGVPDLSYEYVSIQDYIEWKGSEEGFSTVRSYRIGDAANFLVEGLKAVEVEGAVAVFYDPGEHVDDKEAALRAQVRDFIEWLKAQGLY